MESTVLAGQGISICIVKVFVGYRVQKETITACPDGTLTRVV